MVNLKDKVQQIKSRSWLELLLLVVLLVLINVLAQFSYDRFDLTQDQRYSLGEPTKELLRDLDDVVYFRVYLEGDLPSGFRRLNNSIGDKLQEFQAIAGDNIQFRFIDPNDFDDAEQQRDVQEQLTDLGLDPINLQVEQDGGRTEQRIFPGAMVSYQNQERAAQLLQSQMGRPPQEVVHSSIIALEYQLANAIRQLKNPREKRIAMIEGHGQLSPQYTFSIEDELDNYYDVERVNIRDYRVGKLREYDMAIMARPTEPVPEVDKYKLDQFIMNGGRMLWLVDRLAMSMDSLDESGLGYSQEYDLNLEDQLFNYGVRINHNLVQDLHSHQIPLMRQQGPGAAGQGRSFGQWPYYPLLMPTNEHPVVNNLSPILFRFPSTIDTVGDETIDKEILLRTSPYSRVKPHPARISLQEAIEEPSQELFGHGRQNVAALVEGEFSSLFEGRLTEETMQDERYGEFTAKSPHNRMIVVSEGKVIKNAVMDRNQRPLPLGYDQFTNRTFANKDFLLNSVDYLLDDSGLIELRGKDYQLRLLNQSRAENEQFYWQLVNMIVPVLLVLVFGISYNYVRRRRFSLN